MANGLYTSCCVFVSERKSLLLHVLSLSPVAKLFRELAMPFPNGQDKLRISGCCIGAQSSVRTKDCTVVHQASSILVRTVLLLYMRLTTISEGAGVLISGLIFVSLSASY